MCIIIIKTIKNKTIYFFFFFISIVFSEQTEKRDLFPLVGNICFQDSTSNVFMCLGCSTNWPYFFLLNAVACS